MRHRNFLKRIFREGHFHFLAKRFVPFFVRTSRTDQKKSPLREVFAELLALLLRERKVIVARHHAERVIEQRLGIQTDRAKLLVYLQIRLLSYVGQKIVCKADRTLVARINQIAALEQRQIGMLRSG